MSVEITSHCVSAAVLSEIDGEMKMLMMLRRNGGFWCHVAGGIEEGETGPQTIVRELGEETGISGAELYNAQFIEQFYEHHTNQIIMVPGFVFLCPPEQSVTINEEHHEYRWCSLDEACELAPFPNQHQFYRHVWQHFVDQTPSEFWKIS